MTTDHEITGPLRIVELRAENFKRLRAVAIRPNGNTVLIAGENAQGKSSCLDAIEVALSGAKAIPQEPIRHGSRRGRSFVDLGDITVERTFSAKGTQLVVRGKDGQELASPQRLLDSLCAKVTFDPLLFSRMEPKQQDALLKQLIGLDFSDLEAARQKVYDQRTEVGRELKRLDALIDSSDHHPDAPKEPVNVADLTAKLQAHAGAAAARATAMAAVDALRARLAAQDEQIDRLERELADQRTRRSAVADEIETRLAAVPSAPEAIDDVRRRIDAADATNAKVRANAERSKLEQQAFAKAEEIETCKNKIAELDDQKAQRLSEAKFPIQGLGFDDAGPTFNGVPLAQASQAERLRLSVAIGAALNPRIKVMLVREGALLDAKSLALLDELAMETGAQIWVERVGKNDPSAVVIEDGAVLESPPEQTSLAGGRLGADDGVGIQ